MSLKPVSGKRYRLRWPATRGAAMVEFTLVAPLVLLMGAAVVQYVLFFNARNLINHAAAMAVRAGAVQQGRWAAMQQAYTAALVPLYGGGNTTAELAESFARAQADTPNHLRMEWLHPSTDVFTDWADATLTQHNSGVRTIPNGSLGLRSPTDTGPRSGTTIHQANVLELRITHGYELKVPLVANTLLFMLRWLDSGQDPFISQLYQQRRLPVVTTARLNMHSDVQEPTTTLWLPGAGQTPGSPTGPGAGSQPGASASGPKCLTVGCTVVAGPGGTAGPASPTNPVGPSDPSGGNPPTETCLQP